jgi:two-component system phosphate regulon sensor histidine kinase PhoR
VQSRIIKNTLVSCLLAVVLSVFTCLSVFSGNHKETMNQQAYSQTMLLVHILETSQKDPVSSLEAIKSEIYGRITYVDNTGEVVYDSDYDIASLESHADRREIHKAWEEGIAINQRFSSTTGGMMYYCAAKVSDKV